ncbi:PepSY-associated TM helix domain-containing protein [Methylocystis bryophila]|uniref:Peptidase n=1 Tax=Methylocystis bryophila TaxID=655015 RepID=A0A1W6MY31_9HYPH|nr:PepSY-associated TM helix domain-containing protein [Methylocystis bryophila]ARN82449.1 hypothetical protein B1812_16690 [Methylocystis bryophila]BDV38634.1 peptidase [Methylocystis bryophila]
MRRLLVWLHRWIGLAMTPFLVFVALTGSVIAFQAELDHWLNADLFTVPIRDAPMLDLFTLREKAEALVPQANVDLVFLRQPPGESFQASISAKTDPATGKPYNLPFDQLFLNPYTGEWIGIRRASESSLGRRGIIAFIYRLHRSLAAPESIESYCVRTLGVVALAWTIDCFVAFFLTLPLRLSAAHSRSTRHSWWSRWKPAWLVRWSGGSYRLHFDIHRAFGLWTWAMLFVFAWSGVAFDLSDVYKPVMGAFFDMTLPEAGNLSDLDKPLESPTIAWRDAHSRGRELMQEAGIREGFTILSEQQLYFDRAKGAYMYLIRSSRDLSRRGDAIVVFDANTGAMKGLTAASTVSTGALVTQWLFSLHMALVFGLPMQIFVCAMGFVITALSVTGVYVWWKKRAARWGRRESGVTPTWNQSKTKSNEQTSAISNTPSV